MLRVLDLGVLAFAAQLLEVSAVLGDVILRAWHVGQCLDDFEHAEGVS
jgi:hypothetical protein